MGASPSKKCSTERVKLMEEEIKGMHEREKETKTYKREVMVFTMKEGEWRKERKKLREEVKRLRRIVEEKEERIQEMMQKDGSVVAREMEKKSETDNGNKDWELMESRLLVEQMIEERARRDEAVEKWKQLYLAIKMELDDLIHSTYYGEAPCWRADEENVVEELRRELRGKEQTIEALKRDLASLEQDKHKSEREVDILRQSLRIMSSKSGTNNSSRKVIP